MADEQLPPPTPDEESKKDTVRINLPPGIPGRTSSGPPGAPAPVKLRPTSPPGTPEDEAKKETAVMGTPLSIPKPKKDTSRVQVAAAKPVPAEVPRPTVKLKRDESPSSLPPSLSAPSQPAGLAVGAAAPSGADGALALAAIALSVAVLVYLAMLAMG